MIKECGEQVRALTISYTALGAVGDSLANNFSQTPKLNHLSSYSLKIQPTLYQVFFI